MPDTGSLLSYPLDTQANKGPYLERSGIDLDELTEITRYKIINKIYPQVETASSNKQFNFSFGAADLQASAPTYENQVTFDASTDHKIDSRAAGRYLSYKMTVPDNKNFAFIGFDIELTLTGRR